MRSNEHQFKRDAFFQESSLSSLACSLCCTPAICLWHK